MVDAASLRLRFASRAGVGYTLHVSETLEPGGWTVLRGGPPAAADGWVEETVPLTREAAAEGVIRPGFSSVVTVDTREGAK